VTSGAGVSAGRAAAVDRRFAPPARLRIVVGVHAVALVLTSVAWGATRGESQPDDQIPWIVLAALAAALSGAVNAAWLLLSRREVGERHRALSARITALRGCYPSSDAAEREAAAGGGLVAVEGSKLYHRPGCALVEGRSAGAVRPSDGSSSGHQPCGWCRP
jgi:hypothetical protein